MPPPSREPASDAQIAAHFAAAIAGGRLAAGHRLPTVRALAAEWGVPRAVAHAAYRRLQASGLVVATVGRGTIVAARGAREDEPLARAARAALRACSEAASVTVDGVPQVADFAQFLPDSSGFAVDEFRASLERVLRDRGHELLGYGNPTGDGELRRCLVEWAHASDPRARPTDVLVTSGAQQGIDLVLRTFTDPGDAVVVPVPCYHHLFGLLASHGLEVLPVPWTHAGIDREALHRAVRSPRARLLYVMPTFQNPTGRTLDAEQRQQLLAAVAPTRLPILEDDCASELRFAGEAQPSLRSLDPRGLTVTVRSFSKELFPGVRIGWLLASAGVLPAMTALKRYCDLETTPLLQAALVDFIERGRLECHLDALRQALRQRHAAARAALARSFADAARWTEPEGGFALWLDLLGVDGDALAAVCATRGVLVTSGATFDPEHRASSAVRLSLSRVEPTQIDAGIDVIARCAGIVKHSPAAATRQPLLL
ncbi:MAG: PLP-dependent aminotransferase family protein [Planctomycetota bacterium]